MSLSISRQINVRNELTLLRNLAKGRRIASARLPTLRRTALPPVKPAQPPRQPSDTR